MQLSRVLTQCGTEATCTLTCGIQDVAEEGSWQAPPQPRGSAPWEADGALVLSRAVSAHSFTFHHCVL